MQILIRNLNNGKTITVEAKEGHDESIESIKAKIEAKEGIPAERQLLFILKKQLDDGRRTLADYMMNNNNNTHLYLQIRKRILIFVKNLTGKTLTIEAEGGHESVDSIKVKIQEKDGTPADEQVLMFAGRILGDGTTVADHKIRQESTLQLVLRLGGPRPEKVSTLHLLRRLRRRDFSIAFK